jgi:hypothetical protein
VLTFLFAAADIRTGVAADDLCMSKLMHAMKRNNVLHLLLVNIEVVIFVLYLLYYRKFTFMNMTI